MRSTLSRAHQNFNEIKTTVSKLLLLLKPVIHRHTLRLLPSPQTRKIRSLQYHQNELDFTPCSFRSYEALPLHITHAYSSRILLRLPPRAS